VLNELLRRPNTGWPPPCWGPPCWGPPCGDCCFPLVSAVGRTAERSLGGMAAGYALLRGRRELGSARWL